MNLFIQFFAAVFAKFKQKNPAVAGIIALVLSSLFTQLIKVRHLASLPCRLGRQKA